MLQPSRLSLFLSLALAGLVFWRAEPAADAIQEPLSQDALWIENADVFDGSSSRLLRGQDLFIQGGLIQSLAPHGAPMPALAQRLDATGLTLMPGLCDLAAFLPLEGAFPTDRLPQASLRGAHAALRRGVTYCISPGATAHASRSLRSEAALFKAPAFSFSPWLNAPGGWRPAKSAFLDLRAEELAAPGEINAALAGAEGAVLATVEHPGRSHSALDEALLRELGKAARHRGLKLIIHAQDPTRAMQALQARPAAILGPLATAPLPHEFIQAMLDSGCVYLPGLSTLLNPAKNGDMLSFLRSLEEASTLGPRLVASLDNDPKAADYARQLRISGLNAAQALDNARALWAAGVPFGLASLSGMPGVPHGVGARSEISHWLEAGVPLAEAMRLATSASAALGSPAPRGRVAPGHIADLILVKGDPLTDLQAHRRVRRVIRAGKPWTMPELSAF